jgi:hypothetical protein
VITALVYNTPFCCDRHDDDIFDLEDFLPGPLYTGNLFSSSVKRKKPAPRKTYCPTVERPDLDKRLIKWLNEANENDHLRGFRATYDILSDHNRFLLGHASPKELKSPADITKLLGETAEWGSEWAALIFAEIRSYDKHLSEARDVRKEVSGVLVTKKAKTVRC